MTIPVSNTSTASAVPPAKAVTPSESQRVLTSDFETFLKMLTAQAQNQDPLEPLDSTEYASQLAQFSMVEQQVQTNDALELLTAGMGSANMASLAGWVGMDARAAMPITFDGQPVTVTPEIDSLSDEAVLTVTNETGDVVQRLPIPLSSDPIQWAGVQDNGAPLPSGSYNLAIENRRAGEVLSTSPVETYGRIIEAQVNGNGVTLVMDNGNSVNSTGVTALREGT